VTGVTVDYYFEERHRFKVEVYNMQNQHPDSPNNPNMMIGDHEFVLHEVITAKN
jgi:hypothetical protein